MTKKDSIVNAALKLLTEQGVHNTPMSAIAKEAKTGMGTIYNYFPNKETLINFIYIKIKEEEKLIIQPFNNNKPIKIQFDNYYLTTINFFIENPMYFKFMEQLQASPIITEESRNLGTESMMPVLNLLNKGKNDNIIKNIDTYELLMYLGGAILSYLRWYFGSKKSHMQSIKNQLQMVWDAIKS